MQTVGELNIVVSFLRNCMQSFRKSRKVLVMWHFEKQVLSFFGIRHQTERTWLSSPRLRPAHTCKFIPLGPFPDTIKMYVFSRCDWPVGSVNILSTFFYTLGQYVMFFNNEFFEYIWNVCRCSLNGLCFSLPKYSVFIFLR